MSLMLHSLFERLGCYNDQPVEWRHTVLRADRFSMVTEFSHLNGFRFVAEDWGVKAARS